MNLKRINIKYRIIFQIVIFVAYALLFGFIMLYIINRLRECQNVPQTLHVLHSEVIENHILYKDFVQNTKNGDRFYREGNNSYTEKFSDNVSSLRDSISLLLNNMGLIRSMKESGWYDSLLIALDNYQTTFRLTANAFKELGDNNFGKTGSFIKSSTHLQDILQKAETPQATRLMVKLIELQSEYLSNPSKARFTEINLLLDDVSYSSEISSSETFSFTELSESIENYKQSLLELQTTLDKIYGSGSNSFSVRMELYLRELDTVFNKTLVSIKSDYRKYTNWLLFLGIICILILTILYITQLLLFYKRFSRPLGNSIDFSYNLSKGKVPDDILDTQVPGEISKLNENLNRISLSFKEKKTFVDSLLKQKFNVDLKLQGKSDTFGKTLIALKENMRKARDEQIKHAEENEIRRYQNEGIAKFADILRNNSDNLERLSDIFIREMVKYLEAIQGGLFLIENNNEVLQLASAFAYNRKKYIAKSIKVGESLVGTCAREKKTIILSDIPQDYIEITSGLGDAPPNNLLILPVMHEDQLIGVLEIASLKKFDSNQILLGEKVAGSLASTIINARINSQTSELLQKSQQQAAEMVEQEEEMRQNMEELKATQEESARREEELEGILSAIDQSFYVLEYDIQGVITKVNQRFLYLVNLPMDKVVGQKHNQLFGKKSKVDELLFANVAKGDTVEIQEKVVVNKKPLEINNTFSPIRNKDGNTERILNIMNVVI